MDIGLKEFVDYSKPENLPVVTEVDVAFGGSYKHMLKSSLIPEVDSKWHDLFAYWFYGNTPAGKHLIFDTKEHFTIEQNQHYHKFIKSVMTSFAPKHQHKEKFICYMLSLWLNGYSFVSEPEARAILEKQEGA